MFVLNSDITIGNFRFSGVKEVHIKRSLHGIADTATIQIPSIAKIVSNGSVAAGTVITGKQFNDGDLVTIKLGYNGDLQTEFKGFVKRRNLDMPLEVECEGYSWLLRRNTINIFETSIQVKDLLEKAVSGIDPNYKISVQCDVDLAFSNVSIEDKNGFDIISNIGRYTDGALSCFFIQPDVLWCGFLYTPYANGTDVFGIGQVKYRLRYNVIKNNSLKECVTENDPLKVIYNKKLSNGEKISQSSDAFKNYAGTHSKILNHLKDAPALKQLANEKAYKLNYSGYEGAVISFLQPYAAPGYTAVIVDDRYPDRNGVYAIEGVEIKFGIGGARRIVEIGPELGFANAMEND